MNKQAFLKETYNSAFKNELEKIALKIKTMSSAGLKAIPNFVAKSRGIHPRDLSASGKKTVKVMEDTLKYFTEKAKKGKDVDVFRDLVKENLRGHNLRLK